MARRLEEKGVRTGRLEVIPNWTDVSRITPQPRENEWATANGLTGRFVVMHSGNVGHAHNLDALVEAAASLDDLEPLEVVIVGFGARHAHVEQLARDLHASRVRFLPYQPEESLPNSLSAADVHYVGLSPGLAGYVVPSRVYGILAAGRPILAAAEEDSETAQLVRDAGCGIVAPPGRPDLIAAAIRDCASGKHDLDELGRRAREWGEREASRDSSLARYRSLLADVATSRGRPLHDRR
jgi:glycosyltransferase involved in cell wall biosynthesis